MITLKIENPQIENIFLNEFNSNKEKFFEFIQTSFENIQNSDKKLKNKLISSQEISMKKTWDNDEDKAWDEL